MLLVLKILCLANTWQHKHYVGGYDSFIKEAIVYLVPACNATINQSLKFEYRATKCFHTIQPCLGTRHTKALGYYSYILHTLSEVSN